MNRFHKLRIVVLVMALGVLSGIVSAADVWDELPDDALGAVVVRNLGHADASVGRLFGELQVPLGQPLALVKAVTGVEAGLDSHGDMLVAALPGRGIGDRPQLAVWLPVSDYDQFLRSLHGTPRDQITAVTIAGEDLLVARHGDWAMVVDPDARGRLLQALDNRPIGTTATRLVPADWGQWLEANDVTVVLFRVGVRRVLSEVLGDRAARGADQPEVVADDIEQQLEDDLFGSPARGAVSDPGQALRVGLRAALRDMPELSRQLRDATAVGGGLRLDDAGNAVVGVRLAWPADAASERKTPGTAPEPVPVPYDGGAFVVAGGGDVSPAWVAAVSGPYARLLAEDLGIDAQEQAAAVEAFRKSLAQAAAGVRSFAVFSRPGKRTDGVYTNSHLVLRVESAKQFVDRAAHVMARWNELADHATDEAQLKFESEPVQIAGRDGTQYYVDMVDMVGGGGLPEVRQSMERLFGPGGRLRLELVAIDDHTVLVAAATADQAAKVVDLVSRAAPTPWQQDELQPTARLVNGAAAWRVFFSPRGYGTRRQRELEAIVGPAFGPQPRRFPTSPPLGVAGGESAEGIWLELVAPVDTIRACGHYVKP